MTREEFENSLVEYATLDTDAQAERLVVLAEAFGNLLTQLEEALNDATMARQERDDVKGKYMRDFLTTAQENGAETPAPLSDNNEVPEAIMLEDYVALSD